MTNNLNSGALFTNDNPTSDKAPDYSGGANIGGKEYRVAGWVNEPKDGGTGKTYLSLKFTEAEVQANHQSAKTLPEGYSTGYTGTAKAPAPAQPVRAKMF